MIKKHLLDTPAVTSLVSTRVYIDEQPDPATLPSITIHPTSGVPDKTVAGATFTRTQVSCWSLPGKPKNPKPVETVAAAVRAVFHKPRFNSLPYKLTAGTTTYKVITSQVTGGVRLIDPTTGWYHIPLDIEILYNEV